MFQTEVKASMGTMTVKGIEAEIVSSSDSIKLSRTTLKTTASQERNITINDVSVLRLTLFEPKMSHFSRII
jgi:hypothetical protein